MKKCAAFLSFISSQTDIGFWTVGQNEQFEDVTLDFEMDIFHYCITIYRLNNRSINDALSVTIHCLFCFISLQTEYFGVLDWQFEDVTLDSFFLGLFCQFSD